jgi:glycerate dehydrogenase
VEQIAKGFGMYTLIGRLPHRPQRPGLVELDEMLEEADVVSLHCPLAKETYKMVDLSFLARMKPTAILVNTGRGGLIDEAALAAHLSEHPEFRAGLDVLTAEPPPADHPLTGHPQVSITPHVAWATDEARHRLRDSAAMNVESWLHGRPMNRVE